MVLTTQQRREEIKQAIEEIGTWNLSREALARKYSVNPKTIDKDIARVCQGVPPEDLLKLRINIQAGYKVALREMHSILIQGSPKDKARAAEVFSKVETAYNRMLEAHGLKEKVAEKFEVSGKVPITVVDAYINGTADEEREVAKVRLESVQTNDRN